MKKRPYKEKLAKCIYEDISRKLTEPGGLIDMEILRMAIREVGNFSDDTYGHLEHEYLQNFF